MKEEDLNVALIYLSNFKWQSKITPKIDDSDIHHHQLPKVNLLNFILYSKHGIYLPIPPIWRPCFKLLKSYSIGIVTNYFIPHI